MAVCVRSVAPTGLLTAPVGVGEYAADVTEEVFGWTEIFTVYIGKHCLSREKNCFTWKNKPIKPEFSSAEHSLQDFGFYFTQELKKSSEFSTTNYRQLIVKFDKF